MAKYIVFDTTTGRITKQFDFPEGDTTTITANLGAGEDYILSDPVDTNISYITNTMTTKDITARPLMTTVATWNTLSITANGSSTATLGSGLPNPTSIIVVPEVTTIGVASVTETTGSFSITTNFPGTYQVTTVAFPYQDYTVTVTAT